jgi:hypothetical protein
MSRKLIVAIFVTLVFSSLSWAQIDKIALFTEAVSWTDVATAQAAADYITNNVQSAGNIAAYSDADIGTFATQNTGDGNFDIIITFGYFPVSLYTPGNSEVDGSVGELFLEGGDMFLNTADYIFYVTEGGGVNAADGLMNMTDSSLDMWGDDPSTVATADGERYTPSLVGVEFVANRPFLISELEAEPDWELEVAFGALDDKVDPAIIRNLTYDGRIGIAFQAGGTLPRGEVMAEMIDNYLGETISAVKPGGKLASTWGGIRKSL